MLLKQKVVLIFREVIERARQRDEQTEVLTEVLTPFFLPQYILPLTMALLTSYTVSAHGARYEESCEAHTIGIKIRCFKCSLVQIYS